MARVVKCPMRPQDKAALGCSVVTEQLTSYALPLLVGIEVATL